MNEHFSTVGERLANECMTAYNQDFTAYIHRVTPTIMNMDLNPEMVDRSLKKLKANKASGPDEISPKLVKLAGSAILPSLTSMFCLSETIHKVPDLWKRAKISAIYKKEDETHKNNYRPISLQSVPGKVMESCVASTLTSHLEFNNLNS